MDRTVPQSESEDIALYIRTYYSLLRSTREVQIRTLVEAHMRINSALHIAATRPEPDMAAFIYSILRLPDPIISRVRLVIIGQSATVFAEKGYAEIESWQALTAPARRRRYFYDGDETIAVYIASRSDIDDLIPTLTAYQIEREKLHQLLSEPKPLALLREYVDRPVDAQFFERACDLTGIPVEDWRRLSRIWEEEMVEKLIAIAETDSNLSVRLLSGSLAEYRGYVQKAERCRWQS